MKRFFRIDPKKPYSVEGDFNLTSVICWGVGACLVFFGILLFALLFAHFRIFSVVFITVFGSVGFVLLIVGTVRYIRAKKAGHVYDIVRNGLATEGCVTGCIFNYCEEYNSGTSGGTDHHYEICIDYMFTDDLGSERQDRVRYIRLEVPRDYVIGKRIMVAFNDTASLILKKFTVLEEFEPPLPLE